MNQENGRVTRSFPAVILACVLCSAIIACALIAGCSKPASNQNTNEDAIRASIDKHLQERADLNMAAMDREVKQITVNGDQANAQVEFRLKEGGGAMEVNYQLARQNGQWTVLQSAPAGGDLTHPGIDQNQAEPSGNIQDKLPQFDDLLKKKSP